MIDLIHLVIDLPHTPFGNIRIVRREDTAVTTAKCFTKKVRLYPDAAQIDVTSLHNGTRIAIRCCPLKPLQGHNIFGTDRVVRLGYKLIRYVLSALDIDASFTKIVSWKRGEFMLEELHITYRFAVDSHPLVGRVLAHLLRNLSLELRPAPLDKGVGIRLRNPVTGAAWLLYNKRWEFDDKRKREGKYLRALVGDSADVVSRLLRREASGNIRTELKLDKRYLSKRGLDTGAAWNPRTVKAVYLKELGLLRFGKVPSLDSALLLLDRLDDKKLRLTLLAWLQGEDLSTYHERQTLNSRRDAILDAIGIDIKRDRALLKDPPMCIADIFTRDNMLRNFPKWTAWHPEVAYLGQALPQACAASVTPPARARICPKPSAVTHPTPVA